MPKPTPVSAVKRTTGSVHGGQQPVVGTRVFAYAVGTSGYGSPAVSLISSGGNDYVLTDASGSFSLTGLYTCPSSTSLLYLLAVGGDAGGGANSAISMMAAVGNCAAVQANAANIFITIDEVSTVAAVYALAPFMESPTSIGAPATNLSGITHAFAETANLVDLGSGTALAKTPAGNGTVPAALINSLADFIAVCINSNGATTASSPCGQVFAVGLASSGISASDTASALMQVAQNPAVNPGAVLNLIPPGSPFQPTLPSAADLTIDVVYAGDGVHTPQGVAIDGAGNVWVPNAANTVTELTAATGAPLSGTAGLTHTSFDGPTALALDSSGVAWVSNCGDGCTGSGNAASLSRITPASGGYTVSKITDSSLNGAYALSVDSGDNIWVANTLGSSVTKFSNAGVVQSGTAGYTVAGIPVPSALAPDASAGMWVLGPAGNAAVNLGASGVAGTASSTGAGLNYPVAAAVGASSRLWVANQSANTVTLLAAGTAVSTLSGGGLSSPNALAVDGLGAVWIANGNGTVSSFSAGGAPLSPSGLSGTFKTGPAYANGVAIDDAGSLWFTSCGSYCTGTGADAGAVVQMIGAAAPVVTPLALAAKKNQLATRP